MSGEKTFKGVRLSDEELLVIQNIQEKYGLSNFSQTISYLIREYPHLQEENEKLREENRKQMTRIRLASNGADENGQVLLEVLNTLCWQLRADEYRSTEQMLHPTVEEAKKIVKDRIARFKQAKDFKQK